MASGGKGKPGRGKRSAEAPEAGGEQIPGPFTELPIQAGTLHDVVIPYRVSFNKDFLSQPANQNPAAWRRVVRFRAFPAVEMIVSPGEKPRHPQGPKLVSFSILGLENVSAVVAYEERDLFDMGMGVVQTGASISIVWNKGSVTIIWRGQVSSNSWEDVAPKPLVSLLRNEASLARADVALLTKDGVQKAHSDVLVQESSFFRAKIERWSHSGELEINVDLSKETCSLLLECIYGGFHECFIKGIGATLEWASPAVRELATFADFSNDTELMQSLLRSVPMTTVTAAISVLEWDLSGRVPAFRALVERARTIVKQAALESMDDPSMGDEELLELSKVVLASKKKRLSK